MRNQNDDIKNLWFKICKGDTFAFESLFALYHPRLFNFSMLYIQQREAAEEAVSDVFVKCWVDREMLDHVQNPEVYLFVMVKNTSLNYLKRFSRLHVVAMGDVNTDDLISSLYPEKAMERNELFFKMNQAIASLPLQCRIVFRLVKEDGLKYKEVADILDISPRTVQAHLVSAIDKLREAMRPHIQSKTNDQRGGDKLIIPLIMALMAHLS